MSHDGYASRFGVIHQRSLRLSPDGKRLDGEDLFTAGAWREPAGPARRRLRGALPPASAGQGEPRSDGHGVMLVLPNQRGVDLRRLRGAGRAGGKRLSRRARRPAPRRADRDPRPRPRGAARALDLRHQDAQEPVRHASARAGIAAMMPRGAAGTLSSPVTVIASSRAMTDLRRITRALLSVSDKTGLIEFARALGRPRRRADLDRRHRQGARRRGPEGARRRRSSPAFPR